MSWLLIVACTAGSDTDGIIIEEIGLDVLGNGTHDGTGVIVEVMATDDDGLNVPRDLKFNPEIPGDLWIVNRADDSVTVLLDAGTTKQSSDHRVDPYALHFMEEVSSISFGAPGTFGTCQESRNTYNDRYRGDDFMGPALWPSDLDIFAKSNPDAVEYLTDLFGFYTDLGSHLDMLHEDPLCMGIAWEVDNVYWVYDRKNDVIARNDFQEDHGPGFDDHSDGEITKYMVGLIAGVEGVPSHLVFDPETALLYIADTGNSRIAVLDTTTGEKGNNLRSTEGYSVHHEMENDESWTLIDGDAGELYAPSGLVKQGDLLYVGDNERGRISAFTLDGELVDYLDTEIPAGGLMGMTFDAEGALWVTDAANDEVLRISGN